MLNGDMDKLNELPEELRVLEQKCNGAIHRAKANWLWREKGTPFFPESIKIYIGEVTIQSKS